MVYKQKVRGCPSVNWKFVFFISCSLCVHLLFLLAFNDLSPISLREYDVSVQTVEEKEDPQSLQVVEQNHFNKQTPQETRYLSQYNNSTAEEQKGKLGESPNPFFQNLSIEEGDSLISISDRFLWSPLGGGRMDHLDSVQKEGHQTLLNTKELSFFTFYSRVKHQIYWHWVRQLKMEIQDIRQIDSLFSNGLLTARVEALLDASGRLSTLILRKKSGLDELDTASLEAIRRAHPFPNPPALLMSEDGRIRLKYTFALTHQSPSRQPSSL